ncbi:MAG: hypothetical protein FWG93_08325 [Oscillospiraceae bacterium]|nr:hypothetical protein [Oscillospiraceae bacterium]
MKKSILLALILLLCAACAAQPSPEAENPVQTKVPMNMHVSEINYTLDMVRDRVPLVFTGKVIGTSTKRMNSEGEFVDDLDMSYREAFEHVDWDNIRPEIAEKILDNALLGTMLHTLYEVEVGRVYKGEWDRPTVTIAHQGGILNGVQYVQSNAAPIDHGHSYLFLGHYPRPNMDPEIIGLISYPQAAFDLDPDVRAKYTHNSGELTYESIMALFEE